MVRQKVIIKNAGGIHLRAAGALCNLANRFHSSIHFQTEKAASSGNAKSVLSVLGACIQFGERVEFICEGIDEEEALRALVDAVERGLDEAFE